MLGIALLFFISFLFLGDRIVYLFFAKYALNFWHKLAKYIFAILATIFSALPIFYVLWDYYSLINLFYSLFSGISLFSALLALRFVIHCILRDFGKFKHIQKLVQNPRVFVVIFIFSALLFLGHLNLIAMDIFSSGRAICGIFIALFIIALYFADNITGFLALMALIFTLIFRVDSTKWPLMA